MAVVPDFVREAQGMLRDGSNFQWSTVTLLGLVVYVYAVEIERRRWDMIFAGLAFVVMDLMNEMVNSAIFHATGRAPLWTVTGNTSYLIFIGLSIEILLLFAISGITFCKQLPPDRRMKIFGIPNRWVFITGFSLFCVAIELFLNSTGYFSWDYWWWNTPFIPLIVIFGYGTFFWVTAWVFDMGEDHHRQARVVGAIAAFDLALGIGLGLAGWL